MRCHVLGCVLANIAAPTRVLFALSALLVFTGCKTHEGWYYEIGVGVTTESSAPSGVKRCRWGFFRSCEYGRRGWTRDGFTGLALAGW